MLLSLFRAVTERVKALFVTSAVLELETDFLTRDAERKAELLRQAAWYEQEGLHGIAINLRQQAEATSVQRPLAGVLPAVSHLQTGLAGPEQPALPGNGSLPGPESTQPLPPLPAPRKKGKKA